MARYTNKSSLYFIHKPTHGIEKQASKACGRLHPPPTLFAPPLELTADPWLLPDISPGKKVQSPFTGSLTCSAVKAVDRGEAKHVEKIEAPHNLPIPNTHPLFFFLSPFFPQVEIFEERTDRSPELITCLLAQHNTI